MFSLFSDVVRGKPVGLQSLSVPPLSTLLTQRLLLCASVNHSCGTKLFPGSVTLSPQSLWWQCCSLVWKVWSTSGLNQIKEQMHRSSWEKKKPQSQLLFTSRLAYDRHINELEMKMFLNAVFALLHWVFFEYELISKVVYTF